MNSGERTGEAFTRRLIVGYTTCLPDARIDRTHGFNRIARVVIEKLKNRTIWLTDGPDGPVAEAAAGLLRDVKGVLRVRVSGPNRLVVSYNVRRITLQVIEALLTEFGYRLRTSFVCRTLRGLCYYLEDIECTSCKHDQADYTRDAFINRYLDRPHGCRDHRPEYLRRYL